MIVKRTAASRDFTKTNNPNTSKIPVITNSCFFHLEKIILRIAKTIAAHVIVTISEFAEVIPKPLPTNNNVQNI